MHFNVALDLLSSQITYPSFTELVDHTYGELVGEFRPYFDFVIRSGAVGLVVLILHSIQDEGLDSNNGCLMFGVMFLATLFFIFPGLFVVIFGFIFVFFYVFEFSMKSPFQTCPLCLSPRLSFGGFLLRHRKW